jgi:hypothetical protein
MKIALLFFSLLSFTGNSSAQSVEIRVGRSLALADYAALRYEANTNAHLSYSASFFMQRTRINGLNYSAYGMDMMAVYATNLAAHTGDVFACKFSLGPSCQFENEPWVYAGLKTNQKINYGLAAEATLEWAMTDAFNI